MQRKVWKNENKKIWHDRVTEKGMKSLPKAVELCYDPSSFQALNVHVTSKD